MKIMDTIKELNANIADIGTCEKAKKLRKKLLIWGGVLTGLGFLLFGAIVISMSTIGLSSNITAMMALFVVLALLMMACIGVGGVCLKLGLSILVVGEGSKFVDKTITKRCECGEAIREENQFCPKCGKSVRVACDCGQINEPGDKFCGKCGKKLI